jgi:hypothetical protein
VLLMRSDKSHKTSFTKNAFAALSFGWETCLAGRSPFLALLMLVPMLKGTIQYLKL